MSKEAMKLALDALEDAWLDGSMGKGDVARHNSAITVLRDELAKPERTLTDADIETIWIAYRAALPRHLCFARAVIRANNTKEKA